MNLKYSPSAAAAWTSCPGYPTMTAGLPGRRFRASAIGTLAHTVLEHSLESGQPPVTSLGDEHRVDGFDLVVDQHMIESVGIAYHYVTQQPGTLKLESKVTASSMLNTTAKVAGTADITLVEPTVLTILDYKNGTGHVDEKDNLQCLLYAMGGYMELPIERRRNIETVSTGIIQPNSKKVNLDKIRTASYTVPELYDKADWFSWRIEASQEEVPMCIPSTKACNWCAARNLCKAYKTKTPQPAVRSSVPEFKSAQVDVSSIFPKLN